MDVKLPTLGENVEEAEVLSILVSPGDQVEKNQALLEVETEKATVEVPAPAAGIVKEIRVKQGDRILEGQVILTLEVDGEEAGRTGRETTAEARADEPAEEKHEEGEEQSEEDTHEDAEAPHPRAARAPVRWAPANQPATEPPPTKRATPQRMPPAVEEGVMAVDDEGEEEAAPAGAAPEEAGAREPAPAAPSVRRLARELGLDIDAVKGTGPGGRISVEDVKRRARELIGRAERPTAPANAAASPSLPDFARWGEIDRAPMSGIRRQTAAAMRRSWALVPHVTQFDRADVTVLEHLRKQYAARADDAGGKLTITAVILKVTASALKVFPKLNASVDLDAEDVIYKRYEHIGVAVDTEHGLLVPVVRNVSQKNVIQIAVDLARLSEKARRRKLSLEEMVGASFTVTNLGGFGTTYFSPLVHWPQVAVLGVGRAATEAIYTDGQFMPRLMLPLSVSYDHRLVDGADAARFLRWIAEALEQPLILAIEG
jgi:pyruvate dehydrogenase E2 component (dihydrolipoamide acetyltransferase)